MSEIIITQQQDWPESDYTLIAVPLSKQPDDVTGVLVLVTAETPLPPPECPVDEPLTAETKYWLTLSPTLRLNRARPVVYVRRISPVAAGNTTATWQEYQLGHMEETLLRYLLEHQAEVQTAEMLFRAIWPEDPVERYGLRPDQKDRLRHLVFQLRRHIEPDPRNPRYVCTAHGVGYVLYLEQEPNVQ